MGLTIGQLVSPADHWSAGLTNGQLVSWSGAGE